MKSLTEILAEVEALATVTEDQFEASVATVVTDLQAVIAAPVTSDPVVSVTTTTASGATETFVPQAA